MWIELNQIEYIMHEQMSWPVGSIYLQKEIVRIIANFTEEFSLIPTMTWKCPLTYSAMNFSKDWKGRILLPYFTDKKTETQRK